MVVFMSQKLLVAYAGPASHIVRNISAKYLLYVQRAPSTECYNRVTYKNNTMVPIFAGIQNVGWRIPTPNELHSLLSNQQWLGEETIEKLRTHKNWGRLSSMYERTYSKEFYRVVQQSQIRTLRYKTFPIKQIRKPSKYKLARLLAPPSVSLCRRSMPAWSEGVATVRFITWWNDACQGSVSVTRDGYDRTRKNSTE